MILIDMNQVTIATIMAESKGSPNINENLVRHIILNTLRNINTKYKSKYGKIILCYDDVSSWRRDFFPNYKANRKKTRDESDFNWKDLFVILDKIKTEMDEFLPYPVVSVKNAEADDIIAVLTHEFHKTQPILIVSADGDFQQLQKLPNVDQYSPLHKKMLRCVEPDRYLHEHILRGDRTDGIPNFLSDSDCFVKGIRQKSLLQKKIDAAFEEDYSVFCEDINQEDAYIRNKTLIDFDCIPANISESIKQEYNRKYLKVKHDVLSYMVSNNMKLMIEHATEF